MENIFLKNWKALEVAVTSDFIIYVTNKYVTPTLNGIFKKTPYIIMLGKEIGFFDIDAILQRNKFNI